MKTKFKTASDAYDYFLDKILLEGVDFDNTKALFNVGFTIENPEQNMIMNRERNWNLKYAEAEWKWYRSGDRSIDKLGEIYGKIPPIWEKMADSNRNVNSNYGWQWQRNNQIDYVCAKLRQNPNTRHAAISIYDAKEWSSYQKIHHVHMQFSLQY